jgi:hypothetical protein
MFHCADAVAMLGEACKSPSVTPSCTQDEMKKDPNCMSDCTEAQTSCQQATAACGAAAGRDAQMADEGAKAAQQAGQSATGFQATPGGSQAPTAAAMCKAQDMDNQRSQNGQPIPGKYKECSQKAQKCASKCKGCNGQQASSQADQAASKAASENAARGAEATTAGQKCQEAAKNESQMPQMQMPQMPQQQSGDNQHPNTNPTDTNSNVTGTDKPTATVAATETSPLESQDFGKGANGGGVEIRPGTPPSSISGQGASGPTAGGGELGPNNGRGTDGFGAPKGSGSAAMATNSSGSSSSGGNGGGVSLDKGSKDGIAPADIKPDAGYEVNSGAGKSVLGLKSSGSKDDEESASAQPSKTGRIDTADAGKAGRDPASGGGAGGSLSGVQDETSLFAMVRNRYKNLRELGAI